MNEYDDIINLEKKIPLTQKNMLEYALLGFYSLRYATY